MKIRLDERFEDHMNAADLSTKTDSIEKIEELNEDGQEDGFEKLCNTPQDAHLQHKPKLDYDDSFDKKIESARKSCATLSVEEKKEYAQLDLNTPSSEIVEKKARGILPYNQMVEDAAEDQQLYDNDFGAVNEKVLNYNDPEYLSSGRNVVRWGKDTSDVPKQITLPPNTRIIQYANPNDDGTPRLTGKYFTLEGTRYDDLQLPNSQDKRIMSVYEVIDPKGLPVNKSRVAFQPWNQEGASNSNTGAIQFVTSYSTEELLKQGKIRLVDVESEKQQNDFWCFENEKLR